MADDSLLFCDCVGGNGKTEGAALTCKISVYLYHDLYDTYRTIIFE